MCFSGTNQKPERRRPFGTGLVRRCSQGLFSPFFTFLTCLFGKGFDPRSHFILFKWMEHDILSECSPVAAVAFKYLKKTKHRSDILNGLNIMHPAKKKKWGHTKKCCRFKKKLFQPTVVTWPNLHNCKAWNRNKLTSNVCSWQSFTCLHIKRLDIDNPLAFEVSTKNFQNFLLFRLISIWVFCWLTRPPT